MYHVVLGAGEMPSRELSASLQDLWNRCLKADEDFWFLLQAKSEPTPTDRAMLTWMHKNQIWYSIISDGTEVDPLYTAEAMDTHKAKRLAPKIVELMKSQPKNEEAKLFGLFVSDDFKAEEDRWLCDIGAAVQEAGFEVVALNDGLVPVDMLADDEAEEEAEEEEEEAEADEAATAALREEDLGEMNRDELLAHATTLGLEFAPRTRMNTIIAAILAAEAVVGAAEEAAAGPEEEDEIEEETEEEAEEPVEMDAITAAEIVPKQSGLMRGPAMIIIVHNGSVTSRLITVELAEELLSQ